MKEPKKPNLHLVYPHGRSVSCPDAIGRNLISGLSNAFAVVPHDWNASYKIKPLPGDILLGHPHPIPGTVFRRSFRADGWSRRVVMAPYHDGELGQVAFMDTLVRRADAFLAITGNYWFERLPQSRLRNWAPRASHLDLAVNRDDFPRIKHDWNPLGDRRILFIGHTGWTKNPRYLERIAAAMPDVKFGWIGNGSSLAGFTAHGRQDFASSQARDLVRQYDFTLTVGQADANPTTVLESLAWGLIPVCTAQSGYVGVPGIPNVPLDETEGAAMILRDLLDAPANRLEELRSSGDDQLTDRYNWDRFNRNVLQALVSAHAPAKPQVLPSSGLWWESLIGPYGPFARPGWRAARSVISKRLQNG